MLAVSPPTLSPEILARGRPRTMAFSSVEAQRRSGQLGSAYVRSHTQTHWAHTHTHTHRTDILNLIDHLICTYPIPTQAHPPAPTPPPRLPKPELLHTAPATTSLPVCNKHFLPSCHQAWVGRGTDEPGDSPPEGLELSNLLRQLLGLFLHGPPGLRPASPFHCSPEAVGPASTAAVLLPGLT